MLNKKEILSIITVTIILALSLSFLRGIEKILWSLLPIFLVILINVFAKKISAFYLDSEIEMGLWNIRRYGFQPSKYFKKPFPAGILFPLLFSALTLGNFVWLASLIFEIKPKTYRAAKRHGLYKFSEMTEEYIGLIATFGIMANIIGAIIGYLTGFTEFAKISIYFTFFNLIPISDLDGNKIFFGNLVLWSFLATIVLIGIGASLFLV